MTTTSTQVCPDCGGALAPGMDVPPCLCTLAPDAATPDAATPDAAAPEAAGGGETHARALRCPGCGGWLELHARRCTYCAIELATVRCWRCFELAFAGSSSCGACGAKLGLEGQLGPSDRECVCCADEPLQVVVVGDHRVEECMRCGGVFVDRETMESLTRNAEIEAAGRLIRDVEPARRKYTEVRYRACPSCAALMNRRNFGERSGVIVDVCREHGVWFDADELTAVLAFVANGGLADALERAQEEAKRELARRRFDAVMPQRHPVAAYDGVSGASALVGAVIDLFR